ncbi:MAG TPA: hypothetical protein VHE78_04000 [Gemmatimonadaceae bacterium]|nr:hypothetical protein [Gemmatimonadaceae bacterium]
MPDPTHKPRRPYRPPVGIPVPKQKRTGSTIASIILHALIVLFLLGPFWVHDLLEARNEGAGGKGPVGGGGGGKSESGGTVKEKLTYVMVQPPPPDPQRLKPPVIPPEVKKPEPEPPKPEPPKAVPQPDAPKDASQVTGAGGGTGHDGTAGTGPGTGGGVGSGDGTGRGSARGPGTGGGEGRIYPPTVTNLAILPIPVPSRVRPYKLTAIFEVDEKGNAKLLQFNPSKDGDYNKKIKAMLEEVRFRPAVRWDGVAVRDTTWITAEAPLH